MTDRLVRLRDGRSLGMTGFGDPVVERIVLLCHPAPGAGGFDPDPPVSSRWGVHVVSLDRPGYGSSTALSDDLRSTITQRADDMAEYLAGVVQGARATGRTPIDRVGVVGWGVGGRIALAIAARHPGLVDRVAVVAAPAPDPAVPWIPAELAELNRQLLELPIAEAKQRLRARLEQQAPGGSPGLELLASGEADLETLERPGLRGRLLRMLDQASAQGTTGLADDVLRPVDDALGFDLARVEAQVLLVYGAKDPLVPSAHGRWYRKHLPHAHLTVVPRAGHLVIAPAWERVLQHVDPQHGSRSDV